MSETAQFYQNLPVDQAFQRQLPYDTPSDIKMLDARNVSPPSHKRPRRGNTEASNYGGAGSSSDENDLESYMESSADQNVSPDREFADNSGSGDNQKDDISADGKKPKPKRGRPRLEKSLQSQTEVCVF